MSHPRYTLAFIPLVVASLTAVGTADEFSGAFSLDQWTTSGIQDGVTDIAPVDIPLRATYSVELAGGDGVSPRSSRYDVFIQEDGFVYFDWIWRGNHSVRSAEAELEVIVFDSGGPTSIPLVPLQGTSGPFEFSGAGVSIEVSQGSSFFLVATGSNNDSDSFLTGEVELTNFSFAGGSGLVTGFEGDFDVSEWFLSGIPNGTAGLSRALDLPSPGADFSYVVDLDTGGGVSFREATYSVVAPTDGIVEFDWVFLGDHQTFGAEAMLQAESTGPNGAIVTELVPLQSVDGAFTFSGEAEVPVIAGATVSIVAGGGNADFVNSIAGTVTVTDLDFRDADFCPADVDNDGEVSFLDLLEVLSAFGNCP